MCGCVCVCMFLKHSRSARFLQLLQCIYSCIYCTCMCVCALVHQPRICIDVFHASLHAVRRRARHLPTYLLVLLFIHSSIHSSNPFSTYSPLCPALQSSGSVGSFSCAIYANFSRQLSQLNGESLQKACFQNAPPQRCGISIYFGIALCCVSAYLGELVLKLTGRG